MIGGISKLTGILQLDTFVQSHGEDTISQEHACRTSLLAGNSGVRILTHCGIRVHRRHLFFNITYTSLLEKKALHVDHTYQHDDPPRQFSEATHSFLEAVGSREETK